MTKHKSILHAYAREIRSNPTPAENKLWQVLRKRQIADTRFRRQHPINPYIVDFCCPRLKLVIEVDGGQHLDQKEYDQYRTDYLESKGYQVLRFWNNEVLNDLIVVVQVIEKAINKKKKA